MHLGNKTLLSSRTVDCNSNFSQPPFDKLLTFFSAFDKVTDLFKQTLQPFDKKFGKIRNHLKRPLLFMKNLGPQVKVWITEEKRSR